MAGSCTLCHSTHWQQDQHLMCAHQPYYYYYYYYYYHYCYQYFSIAIVIIIIIVVMSMTVMYYYFYDNDQYYTNNRPTTITTTTNTYNIKSSSSNNNKNTCCYRLCISAFVGSVAQSQINTLISSHYFCFVLCYIYTPRQPIQEELYIGYNREEDYDPSNILKVRSILLPGEC